MPLDYDFPRIPEEDTTGNAGTRKENTDPTVTGTDTGSAEQRFSAVRPNRNARYDDDDFWDLGEVRRKVYQKPAFSGQPVETASVEQTGTADSAAYSSERIPAPDPGRERTPSKLYQRPADNCRQVPTARYAPARGHRPDARDLQNRQNEALRNMEAIKSYDCAGLLIRHVEIKPWTTNIQFYQRFAMEAAQFHARTGSPCEPVQFFAYVPQYSKMNDRQQNFYLYVRDSIRNGQYIPAEMSYILLYIYEIINLPNLIPPEEGAKLLADIWLNYRETYPRIDVFLCEWLADYCLIHKVPLPASLTPILPQIVQKAQFKEFYLDVLPDNDMTGIVRTLLEFSSDYDFRRSRYYTGNEAAYEERIREAVTAALTDACRTKRGIFAFEKKYRLTRDAYCGAVTPAEIKRRIDVEFHSFTRPIETRKIITDLVKYAENRLRLTLKIKAKLGVGELDPADRDVIDRYFAPMMPEKTVSGKAAARQEEEEYLRYYEAETTGFDFGAAEKIEQMSWDNTNILTDLNESPAPEFSSFGDAPGVKAESPAESVKVPVSGETDDNAADNAPGGIPETDDAADLSGNTAEKAGLRAALDGQFRRWCRDSGYFDSDMASRINEIFLDRIGDIVLTDETGEWSLIEDYREDVLEWLS